MQGGLLCYEEEDASLLQAVYVALQQVVAHQVEVFFLLLQQVFPDDVCFGVEGDSVLYGRMLLEELVQHQCVLAVALGMQVQFPDAAGGMMLLHVFAETYFAAFLLVRPHDAFIYLAEDDDFLRVFSGKQHQHAGGKISALVRVLPVEGEGGLFLYVGVYIYIRYIMLRQLIREGLGVLAERWGQTSLRPAPVPESVRRLPRIDTGKVEKVVENAVSYYGIGINRLYYSLDGGVQVYDFEKKTSEEFIGKIYEEQSMLVSDKYVTVYDKSNMQVYDFTGKKVYERNLDKDDISAIYGIDGDTVFVYINRKGEPEIKGIQGLGYFKISSDDALVQVDVYEIEN